MTGKKQSGKDTSVIAIKKFLANHPTIEYKSYSFADPLKLFLINVFGLSYAHCYGTDDQKNKLTQIRWKNLPIGLEEKTKLYESLKNTKYSDNDFLSGRELMQIFGTNICRHMYQDCWASACLSNIQKDNPQFAFITDCRFPNEIDCFKSYNPIIFRLSRNTYNNSHISETALDNYDFTQFSKICFIENENLSVEEKNNLVVDKFKEMAAL